MLKKIFTPKNIFLQDEGAAAIEFAFIMPFMLLLYFGLVDVTGLISMNRRVVSAAATMADLVANKKPIFSRAQLLTNTMQPMLLCSRCNRPMFALRFLITAPMEVAPLFKCGKLETIKVQAAVPLRARLEW